MIKMFILLQLITFVLSYLPLPQPLISFVRQGLLRSWGFSAPVLVHHLSIQFSYKKGERGKKNTHLQVQFKVLEIFGRRRGSQHRRLAVCCIFTLDLLLQFWKSTGLSTQSFCSNSHCLFTTGSITPVSGLSGWDCTVPTTQSSQEMCGGLCHSQPRAALVEVRGQPLRYSLWIKLQEKMIAWFYTACKDSGALQQHCSAAGWIFVVFIF